MLWGGGGEGIPRVHTVSVAVSGQRSVIVCTSECLVISYCNMEKKIFSDEEVFEQIKPARNAGRSLRRSAGVAGAAAGLPTGRGERPGTVRRRGERPGAVRRPWRAAGGRQPAVESGRGPSAGLGQRPGAVRRPWRAAWGRPPAVESSLGPSLQYLTSRLS
jgi:hypothetical protein